MFAEDHFHGLPFCSGYFDGFNDDDVSTRDKVPIHGTAKAALVQGITSHLRAQAPIFLQLRIS